MQRLSGVVLAVGIIVSGLVLPGSGTAAAQGAPGCEGDWLVRISFSGREVIEDALLTFGADGRVEVHGPPVVPPLPETDNAPLFVSDGIGQWQAAGDGACAFDLVRLVGDANGSGLGAVSWRGTAQVAPAGTDLSASFTYARSTPAGQTLASGSGTLLGSSLGSSVAAPSVMAAGAGAGGYENPEFGFRLAYDPALWRVQSQSAATLYLSDGGSLVAIGGSRALPTDATACVDASIAGLATTSTREEYQPLLDATGAPMRREGPLAAYAVSTYRDRDGDNRFERIECRTLPQGDGVVTIVQTGALVDVAAEIANLELLLTGLELG